jgi:catechol 2,3-dioxygenase-like lactoylglutathione lyase family enzyme
VSLRERLSEAHPTPYDRYAVGIHHLAFVAQSREQVDERAAWLRERDAEIESGPQEYEYTPGYYAVFFYDPDGIKLEIVHRPPR